MAKVMPEEDERSGSSRVFYLHQTYGEYLLFRIAKEKLDKRRQPFEGASNILRVIQSIC